MSDESLDNLFKKGLSDGNVAFNMESWRKMEQMLPAEKKAAGFQYGTVLAVAGAIVVLATSVFVWDSVSSSSEYVIGLQTELISENSLMDGSESVAVSENSMESDKEAFEPIAGSGDSQRMEAAVSIDSDKSVNTGDVKQGSVEKSNATSAYNSTMRTTSHLEQTKPSGSNEYLQNALFAQNDGFESLRISDNTSEAITMGSDRENLARLSGLNGMNTLSLETDEHTLFAEIGDSKLPRLRKNEFGFIGGVSFNPSLVTTGKAGVSGCEVLGLTYQRYLKGGFSVKADLLYAPRNEVNALKTFDRKIYGFGSVSEQTRIESQRLVYLELPVMMNFNAGNHNFMGGASVSYLVTGQHKVSTEYTSATESIVEDEMKWGTTDGFKSYDFSVVAGYEYSIQPKWNVGLRLNYGLIDVTNNDYFGNDSFDNNVQLRVYLKYSPFRF